jgi:hypothetical protein
VPTPPRKFNILISLDENNQFQYTDLFDPSVNLASIAVKKNDIIAWTLDPAIAERTFQIDFDSINPFSIFNPVSLRGDGFIVSPPVNFPLGYPGNHRLEYKVTLSNGWRDDPDVVPVPPDSSLLGTLLVQPDCSISWYDNTFQEIVLTPADVQKSSGGGQVTVTWQWAVEDGQPMPPFKLTFATHVPGCDDQTVSAAGAITLTPGVVAKTTLTISTLTGDGSANIKKNGSLTVT